VNKGGELIGMILTFLLSHSTRARLCGSSVDNLIQRTAAGRSLDVFASALLPLCW